MHLICQSGKTVPQSEHDQIILGILPSPGLICLSGRNAEFINKKLPVGSPRVSGVLSHRRIGREAISREAIRTECGHAFRVGLAVSRAVNATILRDYEPAAMRKLCD